MRCIVNGWCLFCLWMFLCLLQVNNLVVFFWACVSVLPWDLRVLLDVLLSSNKSFIHYSDIVSGVNFSPFAIETSGVGGEHALDLITEIGRRIADVTQPRSAMFLRQRILVAVQHSNIHDRGLDRIFPRGAKPSCPYLPSPPLPSPPLICPYFPPLQQPFPSSPLPCKWGVRGTPRKILKCYIAVGEFSPFFARDWVCG